MIDDDESIDLGLVNLDANNDSDALGLRSPTTSAAPFSSSVPNLSRQLSVKAPAMVKNAAGISLARSNTLPRLSSEPARPAASSLFSVSSAPLIEQEVIKKLGRWVLCFVSGTE
jgi:hypothetical protein